jgi:hypothetical protein
MATIVTRVNEIGMLIYVLWRCLYMYAYMYIFRNKIAGGYVWSPNPNPNPPVLTLNLST